MNHSKGRKFERKRFRYSTGWDQSSHLTTYTVTSRPNKDCVILAASELRLAWDDMIRARAIISIPIISSRYHAFERNIGIGHQRQKYIGNFRDLGHQGTIICACFQTGNIDIFHIPYRSICNLSSLFHVEAYRWLWSCSNKWPDVLETRTDAITFKYGPNIQRISVKVRVIGIGRVLVVINRNTISAYKHYRITIWQTFSSRKANAYL